MKHHLLILLFCTVGLATLCGQALENPRLQGLQPSAGSPAGVALLETDPSSAVGTTLTYVPGFVTRGTAPPDGTTPIVPPIYMDTATGFIYWYDGSAWQAGENTVALDARDVANRARANHTGEQLISTVTGLQAAIDARETTSQLDARDAANRNRDNHTGAQAISTVTGLQAILDSHVIFAANVAGLATAGLIDGALYQTRGYYAEGDGGGNLYRYEAGSSTVCDGGFVLDGGAGSDNSPAATNTTYAGTGAGRFVAIDQSVGNLKKFGAKGDGISDDSIRFQAALDAASAKTGTGRFEVHVPQPASAYRIDQDITLKANVALIGYGTIQLAATAKFVSTVDFWELRNLTIRGADQASTFGVFVHGSSQGFVINNVKFDNFDYSIWITKSWSFWINDNEFANSTFQATAGIYATNGSGSNPEGGSFGQINNGIFNGNHFAALGAGRKAGIVIGDAITHPGLGSFHAKKISLQDNGFEGCDVGVRVADSTAITVQASYFEACGVGIDYGGGSSRGFGVRDNLFVGSSGSGFFDPAINLNPTSTSVSANNGIIVENNIFQACVESVVAGNNVKGLLLSSNETLLPESAVNYDIGNDVNAALLNDNLQGTQLSTINPSDPPSGNYDIEAYQSGTVFTNKDFIANQNWNLPPAKKGLEFRFVNSNRENGGSAFDMNIVRDGTDVLVGAGTDYIQGQLKDLGDFLWIICVTDGEWAVIGDIGITWL